jgi:hypothetical protein
MRSPLARRQGLICEEVADGLVVYDEATYTAHSLSADAAAVWRRCDGRTPPDEIASQLSCDPDFVDRALTELGDRGLLVDSRAAEGALSRRDAARRFAQVSGAAFAAPLIYSVAIQPATAAASVPLCTSGCGGGALIACSSCGASAGGTEGVGAAPCDGSNGGASGICYKGTNGSCYCAYYNGHGNCGNHTSTCSGTAPCCAGPAACQSGVCAY